MYMPPKTLSSSETEIVERFYKRLVSLSHSERGNDRIRFLAKTIRALYLDNIGLSEIAQNSNILYGNTIVKALTLRDGGIQQLTGTTLDEIVASPLKMQSLFEDGSALAVDMSHPESYLIFARRNMKIHLSPMELLLEAAHAMSVPLEGVERLAYALLSASQREYSLHAHFTPSNAEIRVDVRGGFSFPTIEDWDVTRGRVTKLSYQPPREEVEAEGLREERKASNI